MTRPSLSTVAYEALVRARRKFSNREEHCIRETWTAEQELVLLRCIRICRTKFWQPG